MTRARAKKRDAVADLGEDLIAKVVYTAMPDKPKQLVVSASV
jgi:hypothetical protein